MATTLINLGNTYGRLGDQQKKRVLLERGLKIMEHHYGPDHPYLRHPLLNLVVVYRDLNKSEAALIAAQRYYRIMVRHPAYGEVNSLFQRDLKFLKSNGFTLAQFRAPLEQEESNHKRTSEHKKEERPIFNFQLFARVMKENIFTLECASTADTILVLKEQIVNKIQKKYPAFLPLGAHATDAKFFFMGRELQDHCTLEDYNINHTEAMYIIVQFDFDKMQARLQLEKQLKLSLSPAQLLDHDAKKTHKAIPIASSSISSATQLGTFTHRKSSATTLSLLDLENQIGRSVVGLVDAIAAHLNTPSKGSWDPNAPATFASCIVSACKKGAEELKKELSNPDFYSIPPELTIMLREYLNQHPVLLELNQQPDLAQQLKIALCAGRTEELRQRYGTLPLISKQENSSCLLM